jgi:hypothetical protein
VVQFNQVLRSSAFPRKVVWNATFMTFKSLAFHFSLTFGSSLIFTKKNLMVARAINFSFTLHIIVNLQQRSRSNRILMMISLSKLIMLFCLEEIINKI